MITETTMTRLYWVCFLCEKLYAELEEAEMCERQHSEAHDAFCGCTDCQHERAADTASEVDHD